MEFTLTVIIFILTVIIYFHLVQQYKKGEDLEIYEIDYATNQQLQEICDLKQPITFKLKPKELFEKIQLNDYNKSFEVKVKSSEDYYNNITNKHAGEYIKMSMTAFENLTKLDVKFIYFTENNEEYIEDSELKTKLKLFDSYLKPQYSVILQTKYDIMTATKNAYTPLKYHLNHRNFIAVVSGKVNIKLTPWKSYKFLHGINNYDKYEFYSPIDVWNPPSKYNDEMNKLKFLEFTIESGHILYIPSYWWYSIKYNEENTVLYNITYNSLMNITANIPELTKHYIEINMPQITKIPENTTTKSNIQHLENI
jgi:hypothetical protein